MPIRTMRWDDPLEDAAGFRVLVTRYRPRGLKSGLETWDEWWPELGPSVALHAAAYGKGGLKIGWEVYQRRYIEEMRPQKALIAELADRVRRGQTITLMCSSACVRESRCHRSVLAELIDAAAADPV